LATMNLSANGLTGTIPESFLKLEKLWNLWINENNGLCVPKTPEFEEWVEDLILFQGSFCDS